MKVVINKCFGGFSLSPEAELRLFALGCTEIATPTDEYYPPEKRAEDARKYGTLGYDHAIKTWREYLANKSSDKRRVLFLTVFSPDEKFVLGARELPRDDSRLVRVVEEMGADADGACASLAIVEIPDGTDYEISEYDGMEHIAERHRTWR